MGAAHVVSAAHRRRTAARLVSRGARDAAQGGRRSQSSHHVAHLVRGVQHGPHGRRLRGCHAVLACRLRPRRRGDAPADALRRRSGHPEHDLRRHAPAVRSVGTRERAAGRAARAGVPCRERRRLRHVAGGAAASARAGGLAAGGEVLRRGARREREHPRCRRLHSAPSRRRARRQRRREVPREQGRRCPGREPRGPDHGRHGQQPGTAHAAVPETLALLESLGATNNHNCRACK